MSDAQTTRDLLERLQRHYIKPGQTLPGGVFLPECGWNGGRRTGRCDALYVGFTSTSGRLLVGHEIKASRADWRHELDQAGKADDWHDQSHAWYVVAPSTDVVPVEELPAGWGLMLPNPRTKTRMDLKVKATVHRDRHPSWEACRSILARQDTLRAQSIADVRSTAREQVRAEIEQQQATRAERELPWKVRERMQVLERIEQALGVEIDLFAFRGDGKISAEQFGAALRLVQAAGQLPRTLSGRQALRHAKEAAESLEALERELAGVRSQILPQEATP